MVAHPAERQNISATGLKTLTDREEHNRNPEQAAAPEISFFCPAYLDEDNVGRVVRRGTAALERAGLSYEWIIVTDGSPDRTAAAADELAEELPRVRTVHHEKNMGHGAALKTGFAQARGAWVSYCDGDDQYDPRDIALMLPLTQDADLIIGRRTVYPNGPARRMFSWLFNAALRGLFNQPYRDLGCSFKMFRRDVLQDISARGSGIFVQCEMVLRARRAGLRIVEVPVPAYPRTFGRSSSTSWKNVRQLIRETFSLWREFYLT